MRARLLGPKLAKSPSAASGRDSAAALGRGGGRGTTGGRDRGLGPGRAGEGHGAPRASAEPGPGPVRRRRGSRGGAGSYLSCFSGSSACSGRWLALPQSQLLSRGCLPHCTRPGAPRPARLAAGREETGAGPIRAAVVGGAGRGRRSQLGRRARPARQEGLLNPWRPRAGPLCWKEDLISRPASSSPGSARADLRTWLGATAVHSKLPYTTEAAHCSQPHDCPRRRKNKTRNHFAHEIGADEK